MKTKQTPPAFDQGSITEIEKHHLRTIRALSARRHRVILAMARNLLRSDVEARTARIKQPAAAPTARGQEPDARTLAVRAAIPGAFAAILAEGKPSLRLVVDNDRRGA